MQDRTPKPPLFSSPPQSMAYAQLESRASALDQWLNAYAAQGDTNASVRAVEQRDTLRAELEQRRLRRTDAEQLGGTDGFRQDLDALTLETADPSGAQGVLRNGTRLGTIVASAEGYYFVPDGQLAPGEGTPTPAPREPRSRSAASWPVSPRTSPSASPQDPHRYRPRASSSPMRTSSSIPLRA